MKFIIKYLLLTLVVATCGFFTQKICYRFPTIQEMKDYHEGHYPTDIISMTKELKGDLLYFRTHHTNGRGFSEFYNTETGKAWVFPWESYWESRDRMEDDK